MRGIAPDAVILCINYRDDISYIERTINGIKAIGGCKVIAICLFPLGYLNAWALMNARKRKLDSNFLEQFKDSAEQMLHYPIYILGDGDMTESIVKLLLQYFGEK